MPQTVLDEIGKHLKQKFFITEIGEPGRDLLNETAPLILSDRAVSLSDTFEDGRQRDRPEPSLSDSRLDLGDPQQSRKSREDGVGILDRPIDGHFEFTGRVRSEKCFLKALAQPAKRRLQIMRDAA